MIRRTALSLDRGRLALGSLVALLLVVPPVSVRAQSPAPTPKAVCDPDHSHPETDLQGRVPAADYGNGRVTEGYRCNADLVGSFLPSSPTEREGGLKVERYVDRAGHECAYYDSTLVFPTNGTNEHGVGVYVLDMHDPSHPVKTASLTTPAMLSPHESLVLSQKRGLLVAVAGSAGTLPGIVDVYDVSKDCRHPEHLSSIPTGILGHESGLAPDGRTFYAASFASETIVAVGLDDPRLPTILGVYNVGSHGLGVSDDGNRIYVAALDLHDTAVSLGSPGPNIDAPGLFIINTSEIQARALNPKMYPVAALTWSTVSTAQNAIPITIEGHPFLIEIDEFRAPQGGPVGAGRIIDIANETNPVIVSNLRLEVHQPEHVPVIENDPGGTSPTGGYSAHYCNVPTRVNPTIVACTMIGSGLRIFDIRDPYHPREVAYFNAPVRESQGSPVAMASPTFVPERREVWYTDANSGFYAVRLTEDAWPLPEPGGALAFASGVALLAALRQLSRRAGD